MERQQATVTQVTNTEMKIYKNIVVIACPERRLRKGMTTNK
jgi:hypothetical protein